MKSVDPALLTHLAGTVTTLATLWRLTRTDGDEFFFTDHDVNIVFEGNTYLSTSGYNRTAVQNNSGMAVDNLDVVGIFNDDSITETDIRAGLFDYCQIKIMIVNWADLTQGALRVKSGWLGEAIQTPQGYFKTELRGLTQALSQNVGEVYQAECRTDLGDSRCKVPIRPPLIQRNTAYVAGDFVRVATDLAVLTTISGEPTQDAYQDRYYECTTAGTTAGAQPVYNTAINATTADGTAVFKSRNSWTRKATVATAIANDTFTITVAEARAVDGWFNGGGLIFETGNNEGFTIEVKSWTQVSSFVTLFLPAPFEIQVGDKLRIYPGCDKRSATCASKFNNILNFRGEPFVPGSDELAKYPDAV